MILCDLMIEATLDELVDAFSNRIHAGCIVDIWVFDSLERRCAAREALSRHDVRANVRSAYKPLVHAFLDEIDLDGVKSMLVHYPIVTDVEERRFLLEAYPLQSLTGGRPVVLKPLERRQMHGLLCYKVELHADDGAIETIEVAAPNVFRTDHLGGRILSCSGWVRVIADGKPELSRDGPVPLDQAKAFEAALTAVKGHEWPAVPPLFDRMNIRIEAPFYDREIGVGSECLSTAEAMHEDIYFSMLEALKTMSGFHEHDRTFQPGQIVPDIRTCKGPLKVCVTLEANRTIDAGRKRAAPARDCLDEVGHWLEPDAIKTRLDALGGDTYEAVSQRGRPVWGTHIAGPEPQVVISAGQHSNETSGPVGALRAAERLKQAGTIGFALSPLENPDGYALFRELAGIYPNHMHHAARYTAGGGDLEYFDRGFENEVRYLGRKKTGADLHLNLHGYPAHEWTRPFTGYVPKGFELWTIPKGFFLIVRYKSGWKDLARVVLRAIIDDLATYEPLVALNKAQLARYRHHVEDVSFAVDRNIPFMISEEEAGLFPITIITEAPDETIYGEDFIIAHTAQMRAVLAAVEAYRRARKTV